MGDRVSTDSLEVMIGLGGLGPRLYEQVGNKDNEDLRLLFFSYSQLIFRFPP